MSKSKKRTHTHQKTLFDFSNNGSAHHLPNLNPSAILNGDKSSASADNSQNADNSLERLKLRSTIILPYHQTKLVKSDTIALKEIEKHFGQKIPAIERSNTSYSFGFRHENQRVVELKLSKFILGGLMKVTDLPPEVGCLKELRLLDIQMTEITSLPKEIGLLENLERLIVRNNKITHLPREMGLLKALEILDISYNRLKTIPDTTCHCDHLTHFDLSHNAVTTMPDAIGMLEQIVVLDVSFNKLSSLPLSFGTLPHLRHCDLSNNRLDLPPFDFSNLKELIQLDFHNNFIQLENIVHSKMPPNLRVLYLNQNRFSKEEYNSLLNGDVIPYWTVFNYPRKLPRLEFLRYCPTHGKMLLAQLQPINTIKGWINIVAYCPVKGCLHSEPIFPSKANMCLDTKSKPIDPSRIHDNVVFFREECPPHQIMFIEMGDRIVERCIKCQKLREDIINEIGRASCRERV